MDFNNNFTNNSYNNGGFQNQGQSYMPNNYNNGYNQYPQGNNNSNVISLVLGIVSILFSTVLNFVTLILSVIGLNFGRKYKRQTGRSCAGIPVNIIAMVLSIISLIIWLFFFGMSVMGLKFYKDASEDSVSQINVESYVNDNSGYSELENNLTDAVISGVYGGVMQNAICDTWTLYGFDGSGSSDEAIVELVLNKDNTFKWSSIENPLDNYVEGTYLFEDLNKVNNSESARYIKLTLEGNRFVIDGVIQPEPYKSTYEVALVNEYGDISFRDSDDVDNIVLINESTYNMYYGEKN